MIGDQHVLAEDLLFQGGTRVLVDGPGEPQVPGFLAGQLPGDDAPDPGIAGYLGDLRFYFGAGPPGLAALKGGGQLPELPGGLGQRGAVEAGQYCRPLITFLYRLATNLGHRPNQRPSQAPETMCHQDRRVNSHRGQQPETHDHRKLGLAWAQRPFALVIRPVDDGDLTVAHPGAAVLTAGQDGGFYGRFRTVGSARPRYEDCNLLASAGGHLRPGI